MPPGFVDSRLTQQPLNHFVGVPIMYVFVILVVSVVDMVEPVYHGWKQLDTEATCKGLLLRGAPPSFSQYFAGLDPMALEMVDKERLPRESPGPLRSAVPQFVAFEMTLIRIWTSTECAVRAAIFIFHRPKGHANKPRLMLFLVSLIPTTSVYLLWLLADSTPVDMVVVSGGGRNSVIEGISSRQTRRLTTSTPTAPLCMRGGAIAGGRSRAEGAGK